MKPTSAFYLFIVCLLITTGCLQPVRSQTTTTTDTATAPSGTGTATATTSTGTTSPGDTTATGKMNTIVVTAVSPEQSIMPTIRPSSSVYGIEASVLDTPRSATIISRTQLSQINILDARDYSKLTSSAYTQSDFGTPSVPAIRGQPGDVFVNGIRTAVNADGNGPPVDFNNIESIDIVKGPPNASSGSSIFVGGYVDETTKRPYFDKFSGDASTTIGMYDQYRQTLDFGGPLDGHKLAYRISYSGSESGSYYDLVHNDSQAGYVAVTWLPTENYTLDFNAAFNSVDYLENNGINRVTQSLINDGSYQTGQALPVVSGFSNFGNPYTPTGNSQISRSSNVHSPNDGAYANTANTQAIQTLVLNDNLKLVSNSYWGYIYWRTLNGQGYDQLTDGDNTADEKVSLTWDTDISVIDPSSSPGKSDPKDMKSMASISDPGLTFHNTLNAGVEYRYEDHNDVQSFVAEPFNAYDLTKNGIDINVPQAVSLANGGFRIPGMPPQYFFELGSSGRAQVSEASAYAQDLLKFNDQWSLFFGARADTYYVAAEDPRGTPSALYTEDHTTQVLPNFNFSPTFKPFPWMTLYATFNRGQAPGNTQQSSTYAPEALAASQFHEWSTLYEAGAKFSLIDNKLFTTVDVYKENRYDPASTGGTYKQRINGIEWDLNYQPDKRFYMTASYSYAYSHDVDPGFIHDTYPVDSAGANDAGKIQFDYPSFLQGGVNSAIGTYKTPGFPNQVFNTLAVYQFDNGLGFSADLQVTSPINVTWVSDVKIPWQYNVDLSAFYTWKESEVKLSVYNATNEKNWGAVNPIYGLDSIFAEEPIHLEGTLKIHF